MDLPGRFDEFLSKIRLSDKLRQECIAAHQEIREKVVGDPKLSNIVVAIFLEGSYARHTIIKPLDRDRSDVDVVVVTRLSKDEYTPSQAIEQFRGFLEANYRDRYTMSQGRSIGISFPVVDLDLVVTAAPSESVIGILEAKMAQESLDFGALFDFLVKGDQWKLEPLIIPDREANEWVPTDPLRQIEWTKEKNGTTDGHFVNVVKSIKRWRDGDGEGRRPKGFLIERLVGVHCPDGIDSVAACVEATLRIIKDSYGSYAAAGTVPSIPDTGIPDNNVFTRISAQEFRDFYGRIRVGSATATDAYADPDPDSSARKWKILFGQDFPSGSGGGGSSRGPDPVPVFPPPMRPSEVRPGRFA